MKQTDAGLRFERWTLALLAAVGLLAVLGGCGAGGESVVRDDPSTERITPKPPTGPGGPPSPPPPGF